MLLSSIRLLLRWPMAMGLLPVALGSGCAFESAKTEGDASPSSPTTEGASAGECSDRADNDADGSFDCNDPDCERAPDCSEASSPGGCADGADNDRDGRFDCDDADCESDAACGGADGGNDSGADTGEDETGDTGTDTGADGATGVVAVCSALPDTIIAVDETSTWSGSGSYDTRGLEIVDYAWELVAVPAGSAATMPSGGADRNGFVADVVGTYTAALVVTNVLGETSPPCTASLTAVPDAALWIEMYWTTAGDDMDLHLLKPRGALETDGDCYYANCTTSAPGLDWGTSGDPTDDPILALDDIAGTGPENINIEAPASGDYTIYVHDYPGSVYNGSTEVTVNVYIGGLLEWSDTRSVTDEGSYEAFASINWPAGVVTPL